MTAAAPLPGEAAQPLGALTKVLAPGRPGHAKEVASVVAFLATPAAGDVTSASWLVGGGMSQPGPQASTAPADGGWRRP